MDKVAYYEELIMEKIALNKVRKLFLDGKLQHMKTQGGRSNALLDVMNSEGVIQNDDKNIHHLINAKAKRLESGNVPKNITTAKGYKKWEKPNNLPKSDVLGQSYRRKVLGRENAGVIRKAKESGIAVDPTKRGEGEVRFGTEIRYPEKPTIHDRINVRAANARYVEQVRQGKPMNLSKYELLSDPRRTTSENKGALFKKLYASPSVRSNDVSAYAKINKIQNRLNFLKKRYPNAARFIEKDGRTRTAAHEIGKSGELAEITRYHTLNSGRRGLGVYDNTYIGTHMSPNVLVGEQKAIEYLRNPYLNIFNKENRKATPAFMRQKNDGTISCGNVTERDVLNKVIRNSKKPISEITHKDTDKIMPLVETTNKHIDYDTGLKKVRQSRNSQLLSKIEL